MFFGSGNTVGGGDGICTIDSPEPRQYIPGIINGIYSQLGGRDDLTPYKAMYIFLCIYTVHIIIYRHYMDLVSSVEKTNCIAKWVILCRLLLRNPYLSGSP